MAETSSAKFAYSLESSFGVNPGTGAKYARITSESVEENVNYVKSEEVNGDRLPRENVRTALGAGGALNFEVACGDAFFDDMVIGGSLMTTVPAAPALINSTIAAVAATQKFTAASGLGGLLKGQWFRTSGFTDPANNGIFQAAADSIATEVQAITGSGIVDEGSAAGRKIQFSSLVRPGATLKSWSLERQWTDDSVFVPFNGMAVESLDLKIALEQIMTGSISFMGKAAAAAATSTTMGTIAAAGTGSVAAAVDAFRGFRESSLAADSAYKLTDVSLSFKNATRIKKALQDLSPFGIGLGIIDVSATLTLFLASKTLRDTFKANTVTRISFRIEGPAATDPDYIFTIPGAKITALNDPIGGNSQDGFYNVTVMAQKDSNGVAFQVDKLIAIP